MCLYIGTYTCHTTGEGNCCCHAGIHPIRVTAVSYHNSLNLECCILAICIIYLFILFKSFYFCCYYLMRLNDTFCGLSNINFDIFLI